MKRGSESFPHGRFPSFSFRSSCSFLSCMKITIYKKTFSRQRRHDRTTKAKDFEGEGGPVTKRQIYQEGNAGDDDVPGNIRQGT